MLFPLNIFLQYYSQISHRPREMCCLAAYSKVMCFTYTFVFRSRYNIVSFSCIQAYFICFGKVMVFAAIDFFKDLMLNDRLVSFAKW